MLWQRLLYGSLMIAGVVGLVALDAWLSAGLESGAGDGRLAALPVTLLVVIIVVLTCVEMGRLCGAGGHAPATAWAAFVAAGLVLAPWVEMQERFGNLETLLNAGVLRVSGTGLWIAFGLLGSCLAMLARKTTERSLSNIAVTLLVLLYVGLLGSFLVRIRCLDPGPGGAFWVIYVVLTIKAGDIGAYFTGLLLGRHKLAPWLSPGKTVEGAIGAVVVAVGVAVGGVIIWPSHFSAPFTAAQAAVFGILMAVAGHLGDLVESAFKRDMKLKDSGQVVPAFGGLLDLMDSPFFAAPIAWLALTLRLAIDYN